MTSLCLTVAAFHVAAFHVAASLAVAQSPAGRVTGSVVSTDGERVIGADVHVVGAAGPGAISEDDGTFAFFVTGNATPRLAVRRIGFAPETVSVRIPQDSTPPLVVRLVRVPMQIRPVVVTASPSEANTTMALVRERARRSGNGYFLFRDQFMKSNPAQFTDILRHVPGVRFVRTPTDPQTVRLRQNPCTPLYWVDGVALPGIPFDPNSQPVNSVEAIEIYSSPSTIPPQFTGPAFAQGCGSIVIWTRHAERRPRTPRIGIDSIMRLLNAHRVFVASEVDRAAAVLSIPEPLYPDSLLSAGITGSTVIEFIVEADGKLNRESIGVLSTTHIEFADAARTAVLEGRFAPALKSGQSVAQIVHLPVTFTLPPKRP